jgi:phosphoglycolate phosphatase-like HAD superfamily hydrolase
VLIAAACNRLAALATEYFYFGEPERGAERLAFNQRFIVDGILDPEVAPTIGHAHFTSAEEFRALFADGFEELLFAGVESFTGSRQGLFLEHTEEAQQAWLDLVEQTATQAEAIGMSEHFLVRRASRVTATAGLRAVAFDLDGTLADDLPLTFAAFRYACLPFRGRELSDREISEQFSPSQEGIARVLAPDHWQECLARFLDFFETRFGEYVKPIPGVDALLATVRQMGLQSAIVTGAGERTVAVTLTRLGLEGGVDRVLVGHPQGSRKEAQLDELAKRRHRRPEEIAYVGDAPSDMVAAQTVGVLPLGAAWAATADAAALREAGACAVFASPGALREYLSLS